MEFYRVNKHMIRCKMNEKEINRMGFTSEALYDDSDEVVSFYNTIYEKACEEGYDVGDNYLAVKTLFVSNDKILLSFSDREFNNPYDQTIEKYLGILS